MKAFLALVGTVALLGLLGCASISRMMGHRDTIAVQLISKDQMPLAYARFEIDGWIEGFPLRSQMKLTEGTTDGRGYFSASVPVHVAYQIRIGDLSNRAQWIGFTDIERKNLPVDGPLKLEVRWQADNTAFPSL